MSLDLVALTPGSAPDYETAWKVYAGATPGDPDPQTLQAFADELDRRYRETWPWAGEPSVAEGLVYMTVAPASWETVVPEVTRLAHERGLVVLDPQDSRLYPPGTPYEL